jgi:hypothetical protein
VFGNVVLFAASAFRGPGRFGMVISLAGRSDDRVNASAADPHGTCSGLGLFQRSTV